MTDEQIMKSLYVLADFVYGETFSTHDKYEDVRCGGSLFRLYKKDNEVLNEVKNRLTGNPWHTGTPTEEGWYLIKYECIWECKHKGKLSYRAVRIYYDKYGIYNEDGSIGHDDVWKPIKWQKIEENEYGYTD